MQEQPINVLQTIIDNRLTQTNWLPTTRKSQMVWLAALTAITLVGQYVMLGLTGLGEARSQLPPWFTGFELTLWGLRGLVEIAVVVYIAMTRANNPTEAKLLWTFKGVLIALIVFTVGPIWATGPLNKSIVDILGYWGVIIWGSGLAGISAVMLAGVAIAYKIQPVDLGGYFLAEAEYQQMLVNVRQAIAEKEAALTNARQALAEKEAALVVADRAQIELQAMRDAVDFVRFLSPSAVVRIVALFADGLPKSQTLAEAFDLSESTVRGILANVKK